MLIDEQGWAEAGPSGAIGHPTSFSALFYQAGRESALQFALGAVPQILSCYVANARFRAMDVDRYTRVVAVAGTDSLRDIISNLRVGLAHSPAPDLLQARAKVHAGVLATYRDCAPGLVGACMTSLRIVLVGHSLGAGLACLAAHALVSAHGYRATDVMVVCLGAPRLGNARWAHAYDAVVPNTLRVETTIDPVPKLPPPWGWRHVGRTLRLNKDGEEVGRGFGLLRHLLYAARHNPSPAVGHSLSEYANAIRAHLALPA